MRPPLPQNVYPGVNAHLNSFLQHIDGAWQSFHASQIIDLARTIQARTPSGYRVIREQSLQIGTIDADTGLKQRHLTVPDVSIYQTRPGRSNPASLGTTSSTPTSVLLLGDVFEDDEADLSGLIIYKAGEGSIYGKPIARVELLSPANKPGGSHYQQYLFKKRETLKSGLRLVEIDYLHKTPPITPLLPSYPDKARDAYPYTILISDPHPTFHEGQVHVYGVGVDEPLPEIDLMLEGFDRVSIDFGKTYQVSFENTPYLDLAVGYRQDPVNFDRYTEADRAKTHALLADIRSNPPNSP